jgi:hypothetical protein
MGGAGDGGGDVRRDRDPAGRARNARPRDALGRPLPRSAALPPTGPDIPRIPDDLTLPVPEALALADQLLRDGQPFHAHEVLEMLWKTRPATERDLWQGLAQIAVGLTHALRGNARGAVTLLRRGDDRVRGYAGPSHGVAVARVTAAAAALADRIDQDGLPPADDPHPGDPHPGANSLGFRLL